MKCYKVVQKINNEYFSVNSGINQYIYLLGVKYYQTPQYPFYIFVELKDAKSYVINAQLYALHPLVILECEYDVMVTPPARLPNTDMCQLCCVIKPIREYQEEKPLKLGNVIVDKHGNIYVLLDDNESLSFPNINTKIVCKSNFSTYSMPTIEEIARKHNTEDKLVAESLEEYFTTKLGVKSE